MGRGTVPLAVQATAPPYVWEIANMVRTGVLARQEGMEKIYSPENGAMVSIARRELGLEPAP